MWMFVHIPKSGNVNQKKKKKNLAIKILFCWFGPLVVLQRVTLDLLWLQFKRNEIK